MKNIITITLIFLMSLSSVAQATFGLAVYQDGKLAVFKDDHGNTPFTLNITTELKLRCFEREYGHMVFGAKYVFADLAAGDYHQYGGTAGYSFTNMPVPWTDIKYSFEPFVGGGLIVRYGHGATFEAGFITSFKLNEWLRANVLTGWTYRIDLPNKKMGLNVGYGFEVDFKTKGRK